MIKAVLTYLMCIKPLECLGMNMEPFVVEGNFSRIIDFPHSAYLEAFCGKKKTSLCGGSILNQRILLTAAHCLPPQNCRRCKRLTASFGDVNKTAGIKIQMLKYKSHEMYYEDLVQCDISLILLERPLVFSPKIARIAIVRDPIREGQMGIIAGWGYTDQAARTKTDLLKHVHQKIITRDRCQQILGKLPEGVFCAHDVKGISYPASGDSGSALVVNRYVQMGLVSYKLPQNPTIVVYTDIAYYYNWIRENALKLYCISQIKNGNSYDYYYDSTT